MNTNNSGSFYFSILPCFIIEPSYLLFGEHNSFEFEYHTIRMYKIYRRTIYISWILLWLKKLHSITMLYFDPFKWSNMTEWSGIFWSHDLLYLSSKCYNEGFLSRRNMCTHTERSSLKRLIFLGTLFFVWFFRHSIFS